MKLALRTQNASTRADRAILDALQPRYPGLSRGMLKELFAQKRVLLRDGPVTASFLLPEGDLELDLVNWDPAQALERAARPSRQGSFLEVIHEDATLLVLNKSTGVPSVPLSPEETETAVGSALAHFPGLASVGKAGLEPGLLHRLDTGTSGLLAFAKSADEYTRLRELWKSGGVRKLYRALTLSEPKVPKLPARIELELGHDAKSAKKMIALVPGKDALQRQIRGKPLPALTTILAVGRASGGLHDLEIEISTGVMHQIRCHLASQGIPILGDTVYAGAASPRLWLHAWKLEIPRPDGSKLELEAPLPSNWPK